MGIPTVKTIKARLDWLDKTELGETKAATIVRQAMEYAETGEVGKTLEAYYETIQLPGSYGSGYSLEDYFTFNARLMPALLVMDAALETFGVEYARSRNDDGFSKFYGIEYLNTGATYAATVTYDRGDDQWRITSWGAIVEADEARFSE